MSISATIAPHLPYLRRFARVLTGSQTAGDNYASAALEAILEDSASVTDSLDPRVSLYRVFLKIWSGVVAQQQEEELADLSDAAHAADRNLEAITPLPRAAFLLHSVEGFTVERIAETLETSVADIQQLIDRAGREIAVQISTDVLIIEDEPIIAMDLEALVGELGHRVTHISRTHSEAVAAVAEHKPGLVLADIHLADGSSGLDAVNEILGSSEVPVVFITAYPERLLTGRRPEPTFLITKPFRTETVQAIISQALFFDRKAKRRSSAMSA
jgi:CheY-like chemotaxis protein/DNA-directed RNA polymerase specialized sigma24 family protein